MKREADAGWRAVVLLAEECEHDPLARWVKTALGGVALRSAPLREGFAAGELDRGTTLVLGLTASSVQHSAVAEIWRAHYVRNQGFERLIPVWMEDGSPPSPWSEVTCILLRQACDEVDFLAQLRGAIFGSPEGRVTFEGLPAEFVPAERVPCLDLPSGQGTLVFRESPWVHLGDAVFLFLMACFCLSWLQEEKFGLFSLFLVVAMVVCLVRLPNACRRMWFPSTVCVLTRRWFYYRDPKAPKAPGLRSGWRALSTSEISHFLTTKDNRLAIRRFSTPEPPDDGAVQVLSLSIFPETGLVARALNGHLRLHREAFHLFAEPAGVYDTSREMGLRLKEACRRLKEACRESFRRGFEALEPEAKIWLLKGVARLRRSYAKGLFSPRRLLQKLPDLPERLFIALFAILITPFLALSAFLSWAARRPLVAFFALLATIFFLSLVFYGIVFVIAGIVLAGAVLGLIYDGAIHLFPAFLVIHGVLGGVSWLCARLFGGGRVERALRRLGPLAARGDDPGQAASLLISYKHEDAGLAIQLAEALRGLGISVWIDRFQIAPGDLWLRRVEEGLSTHEFVGVLLSRRSINSEFVRLELRMAMRLKGPNLRVLPILIEDVEIPEWMEGIRYIDFRSPEDRAERLQSLVLLLYGREPIIMTGGGEIVGPAAGLLGDSVWTGRRRACLRPPSKSFAIFRSPSWYTAFLILILFLGGAGSRLDLEKRWPRVTISTGSPLADQILAESSSPWTYHIFHFVLVVACYCLAYQIVFPKPWATVDRAGLALTGSKKDSIAWTEIAGFSRRGRRLVIHGFSPIPGGKSTREISGLPLLGQIDALVMTLNGYLVEYRGLHYAHEWAGISNLDEPPFCPFPRAPRTWWTDDPAPELRSNFPRQVLFLIAGCFGAFSMNPGFAHGLYLLGKSFLGALVMALICRVIRDAAR